MQNACDPDTCPILATLQAEVDLLTTERDTAQWRLIPLIERLHGIERALGEST